MLPYALIHKSICQTLKVTSLICISSTNRSFKKLISKSLLNSCPKRRLNPQSVKGLIYLPMAKYWDNWYLMANLRFFSENSKKKMQKFEKPSNLPILDNKTIPPHRICRSSPRQASHTLARHPTHTARHPTPSLGVPYTARRPDGFEIRRKKRFDLSNQGICNPPNP